MNTVMKLISFFAAGLLLLSCQSQANEFYVGEIGASDIIESFSQFRKHKDDVTYSEQQLNRLKKFKQPISIKVYFGQWCHDSHRETPRIIKLFNQLNQDNFALWFYALDVRKSDPLGLAKADNILKTPTVVIYRGEREVGRILEVPRVDWASDIAALLEG